MFIGGLEAEIQSINWLTELKKGAGPLSCISPHCAFSATSLQHLFSVYTNGKSTPSDFGGKLTKQYCNNFRK